MKIVKYNVLFYLIFRDTIIVDQGNSIWLWTDTIPVTQHLRVASEYSKERSGSATVICKTKEPVEFKALFPTWVDFVDEVDTEEDPEKVWLFALAEFLVELSNIWWYFCDLQF